jgi:dienelactone hydrolase
MAETVLFHHAQGLTPGVAAFADELRRAGHTVHTPDLVDGGIDADPVFAGEGDIDAARELVKQEGRGAVPLPGDQHYAA